jgi:cytosine/adenosine deaminase-related metal-dependent hydrolase
MGVDRIKENRVMIIRSRFAVTMAGEPIENAAIVVSGDQIVRVGPFSEIKTNHDGDVLDLGELIVLPGLINAHCHLDYTMLRGQIAPQSSFTDWIREINRRKTAWTENDYLAAIAAGLGEGQRFGTTTLVNLEAFPELLSRIPRPILRVWWCAEMIDVREPVDVRQISKRLHQWFQSKPDWRGGFALGPHAIFTASQELFSIADEISKEYNVFLTTHLAESREEMRMFRNRDGSLFDFLQQIGRPMDDCGGVTPLASLSNTHRVDRRWIIAHLNELAEEDFALLAAAERFHIAHCPRSHRFFSHAPFQLGRLQAMGFNVCLGTDSLASNSSLSLFAEMQELMRKESSLSPLAALTMATVNGAKAIGKSDTLGRISPGFCADLIAIPQGSRDVFESIIGFDGAVPWMMVGGTVV